MDRTGDRLTYCDGARYGEKVWCDSRGEYEVEGHRGLSEYFFHKERVCYKSGAWTLKCKKFKLPTKCPVRVKITKDGEIVRLKGVHNHKAQFNGQGKAVYESRAKWIESLRQDVRLTPSVAIDNERRELPMPVARQIIPVSHIRTARRQRAHRRPASICVPKQLHDAITAKAVENYTVTKDGERLLSFFYPNSQTVILTDINGTMFGPIEWRIHGVKEDRK